MASKNRVELVGNVVADPEIRHNPTGGAFGSLRIATTDRWFDKKSNEWKESTDYHRVVFQGKLAEYAEKYIRKGRLMMIDGKLKTRKFLGRDGGDQYITEVLVISYEGFQLLDKKPAASDSQPQGNRPANKPSESNDHASQDGGPPSSFPFDDQGDDLHY